MVNQPKETDMELAAAPDSFRKHKGLYPQTRNLYITPQSTIA